MLVVIFMSTVSISAALGEPGASTGDFSLHNGDYVRSSESAVFKFTNRLTAARVRALALPEASLAAA
jgi:hypothetical protein